MNNTKDKTILPYVEAIKINHAALVLNCTVNNIIEWANIGLIDLYIDASTLYGELRISCPKKASIISNYINLTNTTRKRFGEPLRKIEDFDFQDLFWLLPRSNRPIVTFRNKYIKDESDNDYFKLSYIGKGEGFWRYNYINFNRQKIMNINNQVFFKIRSLELNYKYYETKPSLPKDYAKNLQASIILLNETLISSEDFYIHNSDFVNLRDNKFTTTKDSENNIKEKMFNIGKPQNFYKSFATDTAVLTRERFPYCTVASLSRKIHSKISNGFNAENAPTEETIANWLYEIRLGKPTVKSHNDFELVIPDKWTDYSE